MRKPISAKVRNYYYELVLRKLVEMANSVLAGVLDDELKRNEDPPTERAKEAIRKQMGIHYAARADRCFGLRCGRATITRASSFVQSRRSVCPSAANESLTGRKLFE